MIEGRFFYFFVLSFLFLTDVCNATRHGRDEEIPEEPLMSAIRVGAAGVARGVAGLPLEHPWDVIKTRWQAKPQFTSSWAVAKDVMEQKGWRGFYSGILPNGFRMGFKQAYRWPMMIFLPGIYEGLFPDDSYKRKIATGLTIANLEVGIISPLERLKVWLMTSTRIEKRQIHLFATENKGSVTRAFFKGSSATLLKQNVSWVSFLTADEFFKKQMQAWLNVQELSAIDGVIVGASVGIVNTAVTMPLDCVKTVLQQRAGGGRGVLSVAADIATQYGIRGFYAGWQPRIVQYVIQASLTSNMLTYLEKVYGQSR